MRRDSVSLDESSFLLALRNICTKLKNGTIKCSVRRDTSFPMLISTYLSKLGGAFA